MGRNEILLTACRLLVTKPTIRMEDPSKARNGNFPSFPVFNTSYQVLEIAYPFLECGMGGEILSQSGIVGSHTAQSL